MLKRTFVYPHPDDEANNLAAILRSIEMANSYQPVRLIWVSNGDLNVEKGSSIREQETREVIARISGRPEEEIDSMLDFCGFSEVDFRNALLNEQFEQVLEETIQIREKFANAVPGSKVQIFTNFPDGGDVRHLYTAWVITNVVFPYLKERGVNVEIFGSPKQIFDENGDILEIGRLPKRWEDRLPFAEPADVPEISLDDGVIILSQYERKLIERLLIDPETYKSQRETPQNIDLLNFYLGGKRHYEEHFYKLDPSKLDYEKLREQLPVMGMETFGRKRVKASTHDKLITYDHFLRLIRELESHI